MGEIVVRRSWNFFAIVRDYRVIVDDCEIGGVKNNRSERFSVEPGRHSLKVGVSQFSGMSSVVNFEIQEFETVEFQTQLDLRCFIGLALVFLALMNQSYLQISILLSAILSFAGLFIIFKYSVKLSIIHRD